MTKGYMLYFLLACTLLSAHSIASPLVLLDEADIAAVKKSLLNGSAKPATEIAYQTLLQRADLALSVNSFSVTDKKIMPPSGNSHDYLSISRYWWPDKSKVDGLPWLRRDGITNPDTQTDHVDRKRLGAMTDHVRNLSYAYYFSEKEKYAEKGTELIKRWFLYPKTKMNPHLNFAQSVPGNPKSRRSGILDGRLIPVTILDAIALFTPSKHWTESDNQQMNHWLNDYLTWLTNSDLGKAGAKQNNNHGSWYYFQVVALSWYLGDHQSLKIAIEQSKHHMLSQFDSNGAQQHELSRTRPFFYSCFNLEALTSIAIVADKAGDTLWQYPSANNSVLTSAVEYLIPTAQGKTWVHATSGIKPADLITVLDRYNRYSGQEKHKALLNTLLQDAKKANNSKSQKSYIYEKFALLKPEVLAN